MQDRQKLLSFVVVGGGPTGVEVAAELHDMIRDDLVKVGAAADKRVYLPWQRCLRIHKAACAQFISSSAGMPVVQHTEERECRAAPDHTCKEQALGSRICCTRRCTRT